MDTKTHTNIYFLELHDYADYKNIFCFENGEELRNFAKICKCCTFWSAVLNIKWVAIFSKNHTATNRTFWNFDQNRVIFTPDFLVHVRSITFPGMTSLASHVVIFFHTTIEDILIDLNMKFYWNWLLRSRDKDVLVKIGSRNFSTGSGHLNT